MSANSELGGIITAALTPLTATFEIDCAALSAHIGELLEAGCSHVCLFGSTGEGPSFSGAQKCEALSALTRLDVPMDRIVPAVMQTALDDVAILARQAAEIGCRAILLAPPFYYGSATQDGIADFLDACADRLGGAFPIDFVLYHIPAMTRIEIGEPLIRRTLSRHGHRFVGVKDSTGRLEHTLGLANRFPQLRIFTGDDRVLPDLLRAGGAGLIGGMPNIVAADLCAIHRDVEAATASGIVARAAARIAAVEAHGGIPALRALKAATSADESWNRAMPPLAPLHPDKISELLGLFGPG